jgi:glycosyltransferase involved in cell wall biosynthesis
LHVHGGKFIIQGTNKKLYKVIAQSLFSFAKEVIVLSELEQLILKEKFNFSNTKILSNSIDVEKYSNGKNKLFDVNPVLLFLGRIEKNKGIIELIKSLKLLKNDYDFRFILCGNGPLKEYCIKECISILGNDFEYKGVVSGQNKIDIIKESNVFLLPSYFEGLPMALLETMAAGVVPIVTNVGSMKQIVKPGINGLLVEKANSIDLYDKLKYIFSNQNLYFKLSDNAAKTVAENYDISNYLIQLNKIYDYAIK